jgi:hypothetical protein
MSRPTFLTVLETAFIVFGAWTAIELYVRLTRERMAVKGWRAPFGCRLFGHDWLRTERAIRIYAAFGSELEICRNRACRMGRSLGLNGYQYYSPQSVTDFFTSELQVKTDIARSKVGQIVVREPFSDAEARRKATGSGSGLASRRDSGSDSRKATGSGSGSRPLPH